MKERFLAGLKKTAVILIASLMLLGVIPLGMISHMTMVNAEGEFLRLYPEAETSVAAENVLQNHGMFSIPENAHGVGKNQYGYLRFDLRELLDKKPEKITSASLRLIFLRTGTDAKVPVQLWLMETDDWSKTMDWEEKPSRLGEVPVATMTLSAASDGTPDLFQVDLTEYLKKWMEDGREKVSLRLDGPGEGISAVYAGSSHEDPVFRPCLKVVTGDAQDPDEKTMRKATLTQKFATALQGTAGGLVGEKGEIYLKFSLKDGNIQGAVYQVSLNLPCLSKDEAALLRIDRLEETDWTAESIKPESLSKENRYPVYREEDSPVAGYDKIDITNVVNDARAKGKSEVSFVLWSEGGRILFGLDGETAPGMEVLVSDNRNMAAVVETTTALLGKNKKRNAVTEPLRDDRIAENGVRTEVTWSATDPVTGRPAGDVLAANGKLYRPKWFQESRNILATATVSAGKEKLQQQFYLTVLPQDIPDFEGVEFGTMLDIGTKEMEQKKRAESSGTVARSRWVEGQKMTYRELSEDSMVILHLSVDPEKQNYLTVKLWEEDDFPGLTVSSLQDRSLKPFAIRETGMAVKEEAGFCYLTYPIPTAYTKGRDYVSLRLAMLDAEPESEEIAEAEVSTETEELIEEEPTVSVYSAYLTQTPYFDPMTFAEQGEPVIKKEEEESPLYRFLRKIYGAAEKTFDFRDAKNPEESLPAVEENGVYTDVENPEQTALVFGKEERLMLELPDTGTTAKIYRDTSYYNAYGEMKVKEYNDGGLQTVNYGVYRIFRNRGRQERKIPWQEETMAGLYQNLVDGRYYSFLQKGQMADVSVLPVGTEVTDASKLSAQPGETIVLMLVSEPLYYPDFRVSEIGGQAVAEVKLNDPLEITSMTFRVMGTVPKQEEKLVILCGVYERGMLVGMEKQFLTVSPGQVAAEILLDEMLLLKPGQTLKVFVEKQEMESKTLTPVLELPQKQANEKK